MASDSDRQKYEFTEPGAPLPSECSSIPSPPSWTFDADVTALAAGLPPTVSTTDDYILFKTTFHFGIPAGSTGDTTVSIPGDSSTRPVLPANSYRLTFAWSSGEGSFAPFPKAAKLLLVIAGCQSNVNCSDIGPNSISWDVWVPHRPGDPYTMVTLGITSATLVGVWSRSDHLTISGTWTMTALADINF